MRPLVNRFILPALLSCSLGLLLVAALPVGATHEVAAPGQVGFTVPTFTLKDTAGQDWALADKAGAKATVVIFLGTSCPINNALVPRLKELHGKYHTRGVALVGINANSQESPRDVAEHARAHGIPFPVLKDVGNVVADQFAAERTPEVYLLDDRRTIRYRGRIDDQYGLGYQRPAPTRHDLAQALDELLAGQPVARPTTPVAGCLIGRARKPKGEPTVTYARDIAPFLQQNCQECHRPGQIGQLSLLTYQDAAGWADMMREVVTSKRMPPWHADPAHGKFANDRRLSQKQIDTLEAWIAQGCPEGDPNLAPKNPDFPDGWRIGTPDVVLTMTEPFDVPAKAPRGGVPYQYFMVETNFPEDRWVQAAEAKPGNRGVVHHIIAYCRQRGQGRERLDGIGDGMLVAFAPGDLPVSYPPGFAKKIPKGSFIYFQMHYTPNGTAAADQSSLGLIFSKEPPKHEVKTRSVQNTRFAIPPGDANHVVRASTTFRQDAVLISMSPHMHLRGKSFEYVAVFPDGKKEVILSVPQYDFNWQTHYKLATPLKLPAGTKIECTAAFDNSENNPNNPDPTKEVRWGDQTWQEMMIGFLDYYNVAAPKVKDP